MNEPQQPLDLLVVAAHPDDAEISVGGTILNSQAGGLSAGVLDLTTGEPTPHGSEQRRAEETAAASKVLGLDWRHNLRLPNRSLQHDLEARRALAGVFRLTRPAVILAPYWEDAHPDHVAASALCDAARFWAKLSRTDVPGKPFHPPRIYYYWSVHLRIHPAAAFVVDISSQIDRKLDAIRCYASQGLARHSTEDSSPLDDIKDRARYWGWTIGTAFAEPFASREQIGIRDLRVLQ
ncbi:MAG: bacillithiol biosynthesis deacetylase BshB1 [Planctomycetaceae bacterium]